MTTRISPAPGIGGRRLVGWLTPVLPFVILLIGWTIVTELRLIPPIALPTPLSVWRQAGVLAASGQLAATVGVSLSRIAIAFALASVIGVPIGFVLGRSPTVQRMVGPTIAGLYSMPKIAFYPALLVLLGFGSPPKITLAVLAAVFPIIIGARGAASAVDERLIWSARSLGTSPLRVLLQVVVPAALPGIVAAERVGLLSVVLTVFLSELIAGTDGLGQMMARGNAQLMTTLVYVPMVLVAAISLVLDFLLRRLGERLEY
jgi:NitT/TauT family transport system permease protein